MTFILLLSAVLFSPSPLPRLPFEQPVEVLFVPPDRLYIRAPAALEDVYLNNLSERYHYFVDYSVDRKCASVLLRTEEAELRLNVIVRSTNELRRGWEFPMENPTTCTRCKSD